jgi:hypothetical protein
LGRCGYFKLFFEPREHLFKQHEKILNIKEAFFEHREQIFKQP